MLPFSARDTSNNIFKEFEQTILLALENLKPVSHTGITVETPRILNFAKETNTQIHSDLPASTELKTYALTHTLAEAQCLRLGSAVGLWAKNFHDWGAAEDQQKLRADMEANVAMRELKYAINYGRLVATIDEFPEILASSKYTFEAVAKDARKRLDTEDGRLIHGDFWSGKYGPAVPRHLKNLTYHIL